MTNLAATIAPKSDQMNADDLIGGPKTIRVTKVSLCAEPDQPIAIHFEGDNGKPFKPCKSMRRVLVQVWGPDGNAYTGRAMTLYRDDKVQFGGLAVGGTRISHMTDISAPVTMALTATRASRKPFTVKPLKVEPTPEKPSTHPAATLESRADKVEAALRRAADLADLTKVWRLAGPVRDELKARDPDRLTALERVYTMLDVELDKGPADFPGDA